MQLVAPATDVSFDLRWLKPPVASRMARATLPEDVKVGPFPIPGTGYAAFTREEGDKITASQKLNKG